MVLLDMCVWCFFVRFGVRVLSLGRIERYRVGNSQLVLQPTNQMTIVRVKNLSLFPELFPISVAREEL